MKKHLTFKQKILVSAHVVQFGGAGLLDRNALFLCHGKDLHNAALGFAAGDQDALHSPAALEQLNDAIAANDNILPLHTPDRFFLLGTGLGPSGAAGRFRTGPVTTSRAIISIVFHTLSLQ